MPVGPTRGWSLALIAFGVSGLVIVAIGLATVLAWGTGSDPAATDPVADLRATLAGSRAAVIDAATSARSADAGLVAAAEAAGSAGALTRDLSVAARGLASALRTSIFGVEPLAPAAPAFEGVADRAAALAVDLEAVQVTVRSGGADLRAVGTRLDELGRRLADLDRAIDESAGRADESIAAVRLLVAAVLAWLAMPALASVWLGLRLRSGSAR
ncbi:MAG TPA: hypothetical protein VFR14_12535 [Candidatus Limnocylindrales bacterium]|nr:hypothetical protein [Candidatus Limnocylindrales bacterium]